MNYFHAIILGIVQGLTEFLPISSSAHLVIVPALLGWNFPAEQIFPFDILVQLGTLVAVIIYFWKDLVNIVKAVISGLIQRKPFADPDARLGWLIVLASIPAGIGGLLLKDKVEAVFQSASATGWFLFATAALLVIGEILGKRTRPLGTINWLDALWIGIGQLLSIFPGVSRSGSTIAFGMTRNLERPAAGRFSFLMSIPVMLGAGLVGVKDLLDVPNLAGFLPVVLVGFLTAAVVGYLSIRWLLNFLNHRSLYGFAVYCTVIAVVSILLTHA